MYWFFKNSGKIITENKLIRTKGYDDNGKSAFKLPAITLCITLLLISLIDMWTINKRYLNDEMFVYPRGVQAIEKLMPTSIFLTNLEADVTIEY